MLLPIVFFVACHAGPANHFAVFAEKLEQAGYEVHVCASGDALKKFQALRIEVMLPFQEDKQSLSEVINRCAKASVIITDVGHPFDVCLQKAFADNLPTVARYAYYDNREAEVPGGYSITAQEVMKLASKTLFANAQLAQKENHIGLGYYPMEQVKKQAKRREQEHDSRRLDFLHKYGLDSQKKVVAYFGGNNDEYFNHAFPAFISFLSQGDLSNLVLVLQQHPGAKAQNIDRGQLEDWAKDHPSPKIIISDRSFEEMQVIADLGLYFQTSTAPDFLLIGLKMIQVGHKTYPDILIRNGLSPSVTNGPDFVQAVTTIHSTPLSDIEQKVIHDNLGIKENWFKILCSNLPDRANEQ